MKNNLMLWGMRQKRYVSEDNKLFPITATKGVRRSICFKRIIVQKYLG